MKNKKAHMMWANTYPNGDLYPYRTKAQAKRDQGPNAGLIPVVVIDVSDPSQLLQEAMRAMNEEFAKTNCTTESMTAAVLSSLGILPKKRRTARGAKEGTPKF
jgi:hypothetical protein